MSIWSFVELRKKKTLSSVEVVATVKRKKDWLTKSYNPNNFHSFNRNTILDSILIGLVFWSLIKI